MTEVNSISNLFENMEIVKSKKSRNKFTRTFNKTGFGRLFFQREFEIYKALRDYKVCPKILEAKKNDTKYILIMDRWEGNMLDFIEHESYS